MFYLVLALLILLCLIAIVVALQSFVALSSSVQLTVAIWHLPGIPIWLLCLFGVVVGGLLLYVVSLPAARRDRREISQLRERVAELNRAQTKAPGGGISSFAQPVVPIPGFAPTGPLAPLQPPANPLPGAPVSTPAGLPGNTPFNNRPGFPPPLPQTPQGGTGAPRPPFFQP